MLCRRYRRSHPGGCQLARGGQLGVGERRSEKPSKAEGPSLPSSRPAPNKHEARTTCLAFGALRPPTSDFRLPQEPPNGPLPGTPTLRMMMRILVPFEEVR